MACNGEGFCQLCSSSLTQRPKLLESHGGAPTTVVGMTRSDRGVQALRSLGAEAVVADALDAAAVENAVCGARPEVVIGELTPV